MHLTAAQIDAIAAGESRPEWEAHQSACEECTSRVAKSRMFGEMISDVETWTLVDEIETHRRSSALHDIDAQLRKEDEDAQRLLGRVSRSPYKFLWAILKVRNRRYRTGGVVRFLSGAAREQCESDPLHARNLADAASAIANALPDDLYPASGVEHLRGVALKERANASRYLGQHAAALDDLDRAERAFRRLVFPDLHLASVDMIRATVLAEIERTEEALFFATRAGDTFARFGETGRWAQTQLVVGGIHFYSAEYEAARDTFAAVIDLGRAIIDNELEARVHYNVGVCDMELGRFDEAAVRFAAAHPLFQKLGKQTEIVRTQWSIGRLTLLAGSAKEAVRRLGAARDAALGLRMSDDAAKITLDLVMALLATRETRRISRLLREAVKYFADAGQSAAIVEATAYLRQAAAADRLTADLVDFVRRFIARAERDAGLAFSPPS